MENVWRWAVRAGLPWVRARWRRALDTCRTPAERFDVCHRILPGCQVREEIVRFVESLSGGAVRSFVEIGMARGGTTLYVGNAMPGLRTLCAVDLAPRNSWLLRALVAPGVRLAIVAGDSASEGVVRRIEGIVEGGIDVLFIDGDHSYEGVRRDFLAYRRLMRKGGLIAFHDIVDVDEARVGRAEWVGGVPRFWSKLKAQAKHVEYIGSTSQGGYGIGVIWHDPGVDLDDIS